MSMTDVERPHKGNLTGLYRNQFLQHVPDLSEAVLARLSAAPAMLVREHCTIGLGDATVCLVIETVLKQCQPWIWCLHGQRVGVGNSDENPPNRPVQRASALTNVRGPRLTPIFECMGRVFSQGEEGRDWELLQHVPCCDATLWVTALTNKHFINTQQDDLEQAA